MAETIFQHLQCFTLHLISRRIAFVITLIRALHTSYSTEYVTQSNSPRIALAQPRCTFANLRSMQKEKRKNIWNPLLIWPNSLPAIRPREWQVSGVYYIKRTCERPILLHKCHQPVSKETFFACWFTIQTMCVRPNFTLCHLYQVVCATKCGQIGTTNWEALPLLL